MNSQFKNAAIVFDCESTGFIDPRIIEAGIIDVAFFDGKLQAGHGRNMFFNPEKPIELGALNTHHILDSALTHEPSYKSFALPENVEYVIGHNIDYDMEVIGNPENYKRICTLAILRKQYPEADSHTLGAMMYHVFGRNEAVKGMLKNAHSALADCILTLQVLSEVVEMLGITDMEALYKYSEECRLTTAKLHFGKYKGQFMHDIVKRDSGYLQWLIRETDQHAGVKKVAQQILWAHAKEKINVAK